MLLPLWTWRCAACDGILIWLRDNFQGRRLLAILMHDAEATAEELMARGTLRYAHDGDQLVLLTCCCGEDGPTLSPEALAARHQED